MRLLATVVMVACASKPPIHGPASEKVTIIDPGAMPRRVVRYAFTPSTAHVERTAKVTTTVAVTNTVLETETRRSDPPTTKWIDRVEVVPHADGSAEITMTMLEQSLLEDGAFDARSRQALEAKLANGTTMRCRVSPRGTTTALGEREADGIRGTGVVFPDGEIGVGATWRVTSRERQQGIEWDQVATYRLRDVTDKTASVDISVVRTVGMQALKVEPNRTTSVTSGSGRSTATVEVSLNAYTVAGSEHATSELNVALVEKKLRITSSIHTASYFGSRAVTR